LLDWLTVTGIGPSVRQTGRTAPLLSQQEVSESAGKRCHPAMPPGMAATVNAPHQHYMTADDAPEPRSHRRGPLPRSAGVLENSGAGEPAGCRRAWGDSGSDRPILAARAGRYRPTVRVRWRSTDHDGLPARAGCDKAGARRDGESEGRPRRSALGRHHDPVARRGHVDRDGGDSKRVPLRSRRARAGPFRRPRP
jgi:hypothetical protein